MKYIKIYSLSILYVTVFGTVVLGGRLEPQVVTLPPTTSPPTTSPPPTTPPPTTAPPPPPTTPATFVAPGFDFSYYFTGFIASTFGQAEQNELCNTLLEAVEPYSAVCEIADISTIDPEFPGRVRVNGYIIYTFDEVPSLVELAVAEVERDYAIADLMSDTNFPTLDGSLNCDCGSYFSPGKDPVNTTEFSYQDMAGLLGPGQCASRLYGNGNMNEVLGIDTSIFDDPQFCSDPPIPGGVEGTPGTGNCKIFGVTNKLCLPAEVDDYADLVDDGVEPTWGIRDTLTGKLGGRGAGYTTTPAVSISPPLWETAFGVQIVNLNTNGSTCDGPDDPTNPCGILAASVPSGYGYDPDNPPTYFAYYGINRFTDCEGGNVTIGAPETENAGRVVDVELPSTCILNEFPSQSTILFFVDPPPQQNATAVATLEGGQVRTVRVENPGFYKFSGPYSGEITWEIEPPAECEGDSGKLCSEDFSVLLMDPNQAIITPLEDPPSNDPESTCRIISIDTLTEKVCSSPELTALVDTNIVFGEPGYGTCGVENSFVAEPSAESFPCGLMAQGFVSTVGPTPEPTQTPTPTSTFEPTPTPTPSPTTLPPTTPPPTTSPPTIPPTTTPPPTPVQCQNWTGMYEIESVQCPGKYLAFPFNCNDNIVRFGRRSTYPRGRTHWILDAEPNLFSNVIADRDCPKSILASNSRPSFGSAIYMWQYRIKPSPTDCNVVSMEALGGQEAGKHLGVLTDCSGFFWRKYSTGPLATWRLKEL